MTTKNIMILSDRTIGLALEFLYSNLDCYKSNVRRGCYKDEQLEYANKMITDLETAIEEMRVIWNKSDTNFWLQLYLLQ